MITAWLGTTSSRWWLSQRFFKGPERLIPSIRTHTKTAFRPKWQKKPMISGVFVNTVTIRKFSNSQYHLQEMSMI